MSNLISLPYSKKKEIVSSIDTQVSKKLNAKELKKKEKELSTISTKIEQIDKDVEIRNKIKKIKIESIIDKNPEVILNYFINQFQDLDSFEANRINFFCRKNKELLTKFSTLKKLKHLKLRECKINDEQFDHLTEKLLSTRLQTLDVSFNNISNPKNLNMLFEELNLRSINFKRNQFEVDQIRKIFRKASYSKKLKCLDLSSNGKSKKHWKGCIEKELFKLLKQSDSLEELYLIDSAFEFKDTDNLYKSMFEVLDPKYASNLREFHISYYWEHNADETRFKKSLEELTNLAKSTSEQSSPLILNNLGIENKNKIKVLTEDNKNVKFNSIKLEMSSRNSAKMAINFSATRYFKQREKTIIPFMKFCKARHKHQVTQAKQEKLSEKKIKKREKKALSKARHSVKKRII